MKEIQMIVGNAIWIIVWNAPQVIFVGGLISILHFYVFISAGVVIIYWLGKINALQNVPNGNVDY